MKTKDTAIFDTKGTCREFLSGEANVGVPPHRTTPSQELNAKAIQHNHSPFLKTRNSRNPNVLNVFVDACLVDKP